MFEGMLLREKPLFTKKKVEKVRKLVEPNTIVAGHSERLAKALGETKLRREVFTPITIAKLKEQGFTKFVNEKVTSEFKYAGTLLPSKTDSSKCPVINTSFWDDNSKCLFYWGDVQDLVLERIEKAKEAGISCITIHSNNSLSETLDCYPSSGMVIGWASSPHIWQYTWFRRAEPKRMTEGVVIATLGEGEI